MTACMDKGTFVVMCFSAIIAFLMADFIVGDGMLLFEWGSKSHYKVIRCLPNRVFIVRKLGASFVPDPEAGRAIHQAVTGVNFFDGLAIIAEVRGMVIQLKPMDKEDWVLACDEMAKERRPLSFVGLDIFNHEKRDVDQLDRWQEAESSSEKQKLLKDMAEREEHR